MIFIACLKRQRPFCLAASHLPSPKRLRAGRSPNKKYLLCALCAFAVKILFWTRMDMPRVALRSGARLVIVNQGETPMDRSCHLRFEEMIGEILPPALKKLKELMKN